MRMPALVLVAGAALAASAGCGTRALTANTSGGGGTGVISFDAGPGPGGAFQPTRDVDILFMIDNTAGVHVQHNLLKNFPTFTTALRNLTGGLPNLHIAVITSDLGGRGRRIGRGLRRRRRRAGAGRRRHHIKERLTSYDDRDPVLRDEVQRRRAVGRRGGAPADHDRAVRTGGGALGAALIAQLAGFDRVLTCDGGGTSTDVSVVVDGGRR